MKENEENLIEQYAIGEDEYDLTKEKDYDKVFKVYKSLHEDDLICIKKDKEDEKAV